MNVKLFELALVGSHGLIDHLTVVFLGDSTQVWHSWDTALLPLSNLAQEVDLLKFVGRELQVLLQTLEQDLVK